MNTSQTRPENVILPLGNMMYPFMTLDDNAEIVHSEMGKDGRVKVYIEKPDAKDASIGRHAIYPPIHGKIYSVFQMRKSIAIRR